MRVAVVGAGRWGGLHAVKLARLPGVRVVAVVDPVAARAMAVAGPLGAIPLPDLTSLSGIDAATVAVPIDQLAAVTAALLRLGLPVLAEKPLARTTAEAETLIALAGRCGGRLAVGFVERFNPAVPTSAEDHWIARRVGPHAPRQRLALDWLVHDLDLARWRLGPLLPQLGTLAVSQVIWRGLSETGVRVRLSAARAATPRRRLRTELERADLRGEADALGAELAQFAIWAGGGEAGSMALGADALACLRLLAAVGLSG